MEEGGRSPREEAAEPQESGGDAEPGGGGGRRGLLLPPGDPPHPHPHPHRITNFFIDNILRPEFGRRKEAGGPGGEPRRPGAESRRSPAAAPAPGAPLPGGGAGSPGRGEGGGPAGLALHGAAKKGGDPAALEAALKARGLSGGDLSVSSDSDSSQASSNAGNQPMLWPAWVYCTRYSDRPSSGKSCPAGPTLSPPPQPPPRGSPARLRPPAGPGKHPAPPFPAPPSWGFFGGLFGWGFLGGGGEGVAWGCAEPEDEGGAEGLSLPAAGARGISPQPPGFIKEGEGKKKNK